MPGLSESIQASQARARADFDEIKRQLHTVVEASDQKDDIIDSMAALDLTQNAEIAALKAERDQLNIDIAAAVDALDAFDLDASFPAAPGEGEPAPEPAPGEGGAVNPPEPPPPDEIPPVGTGTTPDTPPPPPDPTPEEPAEPTEEQPPGE